MTTPEPAHDTLRFVIQCEWNDIHHTRNQDWTILAFVGAFHFGIFQFMNEYITNENYSFWLFAPTLFITLLSIFVHLRHYNIDQIKKRWITVAETKLGLIDDKKQGDIISPCEIDAIKYPSIRFLIFGFDAVFLLLNLTAAIFGQSLIQTLTL